MSITNEQIDKIFAFIEANPAAAPENKSVLATDIDSFQKNFNATMQTFLDNCQFDDAETIEIITKLFLIKEPQIHEAEAGKLFMNMFGDRTAIFGVTGLDDDRFKLLTCVYTTPEDTDENTLSSMVLAYFVQTLLPDVDAENFLRELTTTGKKVSGGVSFSIAADGNLIFVTAVAE